MKHQNLDNKTSDRLHSAAVNDEKNKIRGEEETPSAVSTKLDVAPDKSKKKDKEGIELGHRQGKSGEGEQKCRLELAPAVYVEENVIRRGEGERKCRLELAPAVYVEENDIRADKKGAESKRLSISKNKSNNGEKGKEKAARANQKRRGGRPRTRTKAPVESDDDSVDVASLDSDEIPGAHHVGGGVRDQPGAIARQQQDSIIMRSHVGALPIRGMGSEADGPIQYDCDEIAATITTAQVVDEEALEQEIAARKSIEIRDRILSNAATATKVKKEQTLYQKYCVFCGCILISITLAVVLSVTLSKREAAKPLVGYDYLLDLLSPISGTGVLLNETTAQFDALNWLAFDDISGIPLTESNSEVLKTSLEERYVAALLYFSTGGANWTSSYGFLTNTSICEWSGAITCNQGGFVHSISLEANNMYGNIPSELWALKALQTLKLSNNHLYGSLPQTLGDMPNLRRLYLDQNRLTGEIPVSFGGLKGLEILSLWRNTLSGNVPNAVMSLASLEEIVIGDNFFTGSIPDFRPRGPMRRIRLGKNFFEGTIPDTVYQLSSLEDLYLESNELGGTLSSTALGNLVSLQHVCLWRNNFVGSLPSQIGKMKDLVVLDVESNMFHQTIPTEFGELDRLVELVLAENDLTGTIPSELQHLSNLRKLILSSNLLSGIVPPELRIIGSLHEGVVALHNNSLSGSLDSVFCSQNITGLPPPLTLTADCGEIDCSCCTDCCEDLTGNCMINVHQICQRLAYKAENRLSMASWGTICRCREGDDEGIDDGFVHLECSDSCHSCNAEGNFCLEKYNYGFDLPKSTGLDNLYECNMRTIVDDSIPYWNNDMSYQMDYLTYQCSLSINGTLCNSCLADRKCADGFIGFLIDCSNIEADAIYDDCDQGLNDGELLQFLRPEYFEQECRPCIFEK